MARLIFLGSTLFGHVLPTIPLIKALAAEGEEIIYYSDEVHEQRITSAGATFRPYRMAWKIVDARSEEIRGFKHDVFAARCEEFLRMHCEEVCQQRPDYLVHDAFHQYVVAGLLSQRLQVPGVVVYPYLVNPPSSSPQEGPETVRQRMSKAIQVWGRVRQQFGFQPLRTLRTYHPLAVVLTSRHFQPRAHLFGDRYVFVGQTFDEPGPPGPGLNGGAGRVYITLGTIGAKDREHFLDVCFEALGADDVEVVLSLGGTADEGGCGSPPANFHLHSFIPEEEELSVISNADVVVSRAGFSTLHKCMYYGTPSVVIPHLPEQKANAERAHDLGAAIALDRQGLTAEILRSAIDRVRREDSFRRSCERVSESLKTAGGIELAARRIRDFIHSDGKLSDR